VNEYPSRDVQGRERVDLHESDFSHDLFICKDLREKPPRMMVFPLFDLPFCFVIHATMYIITPFIFIIFPSQLSYYDTSYFILYIFSSL